MLNRHWPQRLGLVQLLFIWIFLILSPSICFGAVQESVSGNQSAYLTPDREINRQLKTGEKIPADVFGVRASDDGLVVNPLLKDGWTWLAAKNLEIQGERLSFFFYDGWIYTDAPILTAHRRQKFRKDVSDLIRSNVFTLAFYAEKVIEKELVIFLASEESVEAEIVIDKQLWGEEKRITRRLLAGEGHFISVMKMSGEFRPLFFSADESLRTHMDLNENWKFTKQDVPEAFEKNLDDDAWETVSIPHCWNRKDVYDTRNMFNGYEIFHGYYRGPGWYRKQIRIDDAFKGKRVFIEFEGANQVADVWMNGQYIGKHEGGYTGFSFDVTDHVQFGKMSNIIAVRVDNSYDYDLPPHTADFNMYGGLYRDVRMVFTGKVYLQTIHVTTPEVSIRRAKTQIQAHACNDMEGEIESVLLSNIVNTDGEIEATVQTSHRIPSHSRVEIQQSLPEIPYPCLWSPDTPYLYSVYTTLIVDDQAIDEIVTPLGFRWFRFDADEGFFLNDQHLKLKGVNKHQDYHKHGNAVPDSLLIRDVELIKEMGTNFIRLSHYPHDPSVLDACDRLGLLVWEEIPLVNSIGEERFAENTLKMMREMIRRDWNHPSVILWGITNESAMGFANQEQIPKITKLLQDLHDLAREEDPARLTIQAHNHFKDIRIADITEVIGRNRYYGWYEGNLKDFDKAMDQERLEHPEWIVVISEYGVGSKRGYHVDNPVAFDFSEEYQLDFHEHYWKAISARPWIAGSAVWNAMDFGSFVKRGNIPRINQKGLWDMERKPKDVYYFYKSQWTDEPMVYIVSHTRRYYTGTSGDAIRIRVYSNCDEVELFLNEVSLGKKVNEYVYNWDVVLRPGENRLNAVAQKGRHFIEDKIQVILLADEVE